MTAAARKKPAPRSSAELEQAVRAAEAALLEATRSRETAKGALPDAIKQGDAEAIAELRRAIGAGAAAIEAAETNLAATRDAYLAALADEHAAVAVENYRTITKVVGRARKDVDAAEDGLVAACAAFKRARLSVEAADGELVSCGITPDPYVLKAKLVGIATTLLAIESDGVLASTRVLDNAAQLRASGAASLKRAASEFEILTLRRARSALRIPEEA